MQLNKDILTKEKLNIDLIKYPFHSYPFPKSLPFGQELASGANGGACAAVERKRQYREIAYLMLRSRTPFLRVGV